MPQFLIQHSITLFFGFTTLVTSALAVYYQRLEHRRRVEAVIDGSRRAGLFLSRQAMVRYLLQMYDKAEAGDVIWAQCVRCTDFSPEIRNQILKAAGKGVKFRMAINQYSPSLEEFQALFEPIESAELVTAPDNAISIQGLSAKEVVLAFPGVDSYTAVLIRNQAFAKMLKTWFDARFSQLQPPRKA